MSDDPRFHRRWSGTVKEAWTELCDIANPSQETKAFPKSDPSFPGSPRSLRKALDRVKSILMDHGILYEIGERCRTGYPITFRKIVDLRTQRTQHTQALTNKELPPVTNVTHTPTPEPDSGRNSLTTNGGVRRELRELVSDIAPSGDEPFDHDDQTETI